MASTNKTNKLGLNIWQTSDKPEMDDFNSDNRILESALDNTYNLTDIPSPLGMQHLYIDAVRGSDDNDGFTPGGAFKTLDKAILYMHKSLPRVGSGGGHGFYFWLFPGTYEMERTTSCNGNILLSIRGYADGGGTRDNVIIKINGANLAFQRFGYLQLIDLTFQATAGDRGLDIAQSRFYVANVKVIGVSGATYNGIVLNFSQGHLHNISISNATNSVLACNATLVHANDLTSSGCTNSYSSSGGIIIRSGTTGLPSANIEVKKLGGQIFS